MRDAISVTDLAKRNFISRKRVFCYLAVVEGLAKQKCPPIRLCKMGWVGGHFPIYPEWDTGGRG